ncbi:hypothetical protein Plec18167_002475 [Paecilomyces lecythidis]|uniref:FAD-binding domain-containing protein n=1 Tax=Paecilomyces lecythidis TaxID=3004212 RepID=A0ABR3Y5A3_9EURO
MPSDFKVIIVGGGPIGLLAAHALQLAGIDFVVLEQRPRIVEDQGASIIVWPHTLRVMHQLGILEDLLSMGDELKRHLSFTKEGYAFSVGDRWERTHQNHGYWPVAFHRAELIEVLYNTLPPDAKEKVFTSKGLVDIEADEAGVRATCIDGSFYKGSLVIGADGVHSKTRSQMRKLALEADTQRDWDPEEPYLSTYRLLFGSFPSPCQPNFGYDTHSQDKSISFFSGEKRGWFFLYEKLPSPTQERVKYTEDDIQAVAKEFSDFALTQTVKVKDVWSQMCGYGMTTLQEGILGHWTFGRVVLIGDSCHKFTTHIGLGFNNGVQDVVVLFNALRKAVHQSSSGIPGYLTLIKALQTHEESRKDHKFHLYYLIS